MSLESGGRRKRLDAARDARCLLPFQQIEHRLSIDIEMSPRISNQPQAAQPVHLAAYNLTRRAHEFCDSVMSEAPDAGRAVLRRAS